jgi:hypothetical protein
MAWYQNDLTLYTQHEAIHRLKKNTFCTHSFILSHEAIQGMIRESKKEEELIMK